MLQRYRINNCADIAEDGGGYCLSEDVAELEASNQEMKKALTSAADELVSLIDKVNADLKSKISSTDLDDPDYYDYQTPHDLMQIVNKLQQPTGKG